MLTFDGKIVVVTGASSGIGAATAVEFSKEGASVVLIARNEERLNFVLGQCKSAGTGDHLVITADLRDPTQVESVMVKTISKYGRLNILVNNAGAGRYGGIDVLTMEDFDWMISLNLRSVVQLTKLAIPHLTKTKGNVVNVSSISGINVRADASTYCMSKGALDQFTKCTALDVGGKGIRVNSVNPALITTNFLKAMGMSDDQYNKRMEHCSQKYPLKRVGEPHEVADAILFLAKDTSSFLTGVILPVTGGKHIDFSS